jgi:intracellular sulfur oxidation DsrE/DsrF family protein
MQRKSFLVSAVPLAACATAACAGKGGSAIGLVETAAQFDAHAFDKLVATNAEFRQVWDAGELQPRILGGVKNSLNGLQFGFNVAPANIAVAFVAHNTSNLLLYDDTAWSTYVLGQLFEVKDPTGAVVQSNIFAPSRSTNAMADPSDVHGFYQDASITTLQRRGVHFFVCNTALVQQAEAIVRAGATRQSPQEVAEALRSHLLPGVMLVPSGVAAIAYLQSRYHYGYAAGAG